MILTIITINRDNAFGLEKTLKSVSSQSFIDFEYVIVDGASKDGSEAIIKKYENTFEKRLKWISEPDEGIYDAMNKGIEIACGEYVEFLNSGDCLASNDVIEKIIRSLDNNGFPSILYGNMIKISEDGKHIHDKGLAGQNVSFLTFYKGTINHPAAFIRKDLFEKYGKYDENLKIVSDWKWFLQAIALGGENPVYADIDVAAFDMSVISESNRESAIKERKGVLEQFIPKTILDDYEEWSGPISQMKRLKRHPWAYKLVWLLERVLFKIEKHKR